MMELELTKEQLMDFASKIFDMNFPDKGYTRLEDQPFHIQSDWISRAIDIVEDYNCLVKNIDFPGISVMKNCCLICKHVDLYRPACNLRGDDISLECVCSKFELFEFEDDEDDEDD